MASNGIKEGDILCSSNRNLNLTIQKLKQYVHLIGSWIQYCRVTYNQNIMYTVDAYVQNIIQKESMKFLSPNSLSAAHIKVFYKHVKFVTSQKISSWIVFFVAKKQGCMNNHCLKGNNFRSNIECSWFWIKYFNIKYVYSMSYCYIYIYMLLYLYPLICCYIIAGYMKIVDILWS